VRLYVGAYCKAERLAVYGLCSVDLRTSLQLYTSFRE